MKPRDTQRLTFTPVSMADLATLHRLNNAPGVMKFLERVPPPMEYLRVKTIPERMRMAQEHAGYGMWLAKVRDSDEFVGRFGLRPNFPQEGDAEVGYRLMPDQWGKGFATEACTELVRYTFEDLKARRFVGITMFVNEPSRKVMERIGLTYVKTFHAHFEDPLPGTELGEVEYALSREHWLASRA